MLVAGVDYEVSTCPVCDESTCAFVRGGDCWQAMQQEPEIYVVCRRSTAGHGRKIDLCMPTTHDAAYRLSQQARDDYPASNVWVEELHPSIAQAILEDQ